MNWKARIVRVLVRAYPGSWRAEYGAELEGLLLSTGLSPAAVADVVRAAAIQHLKRDEPWKLCAVLLALWALICSAWNTARPLSTLFYTAELPSCSILLAGAFWSALRRPGMRFAVWDMTKAACFARLPDLLLCTFWASGILQPAIFDSTGSIAHPGRIALLYLRTSRQVLVNPVSVLSLEICAGMAEGMAVGAAGALLGCLAGRIQKRLRAR